MNKLFENMNKSLANKAEELMEFLISPLYMIIHTVAVLLIAHFDILKSPETEKFSYIELVINYGLSSFVYYIGFMFVLYIIADSNFVNE